MDARQRPLSEIIAKSLYSDSEIVNSDLVRLSDLNDDDLYQFRKAWSNAEVTRRADVAGKLVSLGEEDVTQDFTRLFKTFLDDPDPGIRIRALEGLELEDKYAVVRPILKTLKSDESAEVREAAARAAGKFALLAELGDLPEAVGKDIFDVLLDVLENTAEPIAVRRRALESIAPFQQELVDNYIEDYYYSQEPGVKASALFAMGRNCQSRWLNFLIDELQSSDSEIRFEAARSSGEIGEEEAVPGLLVLLDDNDHEVQEAAIMALGKIGGQEARQALQQLSKSQDTRIKEAAKSALTELETCEDPLSSNF
jgi:HEAT repeat protein